MKLFCIFLFTFSITNADEYTQKKKSVYGTKIDKSIKVIQLQTAIKMTKENKLANIVIEGQVEKVCQKKGCWMMIKDGPKKIRVTFKDYGFFVPVALVNKKIRAQGNIIRKKQSVAEIRHFLKDEGAPEKTINAVKTGKESFIFEASGIEQI